MCPGESNFYEFRLYVAKQLQISLRKHSLNDWKPEKISPLRFHKGYFFFVFATFGTQKGHLAVSDEQMVRQEVLRR